jgi:hypothetical protein
LFLCGSFALAYSVGINIDPENINYDQAANLGFGMIGLCGGSGFFALVGLILGIIGVTQKDTARAWAIIGLTLNGVITLGYCSLFGLGFISSFMSA